ncbi:hypothetical protein [Tropicibacter oceani]|uniref:Uncharacterized protein n=1 Tax=Tropicibacter oceani TaxID=3058420 RepID=A0ABY8QJ82_9RHOB|nr:hypothetical protein [Tropicibacter oceani]WGW04694.1 hypothetical protein QF118_03845 [Tropicibacter oceani]
MSRLWKILKRLLLVVAVLVLGLLAPVAYTETMCRGTAVARPYAPLIAPEFQRPESRTLMTYPEWDIVHAYEDYARVIATGDPHDYGFLRGIGGFWTSLCALSRTAPAHGEIDGETRQMVYVIGVSFTAEFLLKAAYEETLGRLFAALRGPERAPLDALSARQAAQYAAFLQQVPWYKWQFREDAQDLRAAATMALRDRERGLALGLEYGAKAAYAGIIEQAVAQVGADELTLRMIVTGASPDQIAGFKGVTVLRQHPAGTEIEVPRYRALTHLLVAFAKAGMAFVEIAGNDDILFTALSDAPQAPGAIFSRARQGAGDFRHLIVVPVAELADRLRQLDALGLRLEHVHDY